MIFFLSHIFLHILQVSQEQELSERRKTTVTYKKFNMQMNFRINECGVQRVNDGCVMSMSMFEFVFKLVYYIVPQSWNKLHFSRSIDTFSTAKSLIHVLFCLAFILNPIHIESHPFYILCTLCNILIKCIIYLWSLLLWFYKFYFFIKLSNLPNQKTHYCKMAGIVLPSKGNKLFSWSSQNVLLPSWSN